MTDLADEQHRLINCYAGVLLKPEQLSEYQRWALEFFHEPQYVANPNLAITLQLDITTAYASYNNSICRKSFTAYLIWKLIQSLKQHPCFNYRRIGTQWYDFKNLPLFFPVATGRAERFGEVLIENVRKMDWQTFSNIYRNEVNAIANTDTLYTATDTFTWSVADFIGNLPKLRFSALSLQRPAEPNGRPIFYFGQRYLKDGVQQVALSITFDHANTDPVLLNHLIDTYTQQLAIAES